MGAAPAREKIERSNLDVTAIARARQDVRAEMLQERLDRAIAALIASKLGDAENLAARRDVLFELYEADILTRTDVRERGGIEPDDFYPALDDFRRRRQQR